MHSLFSVYNMNILMLKKLHDVCNWNNLLAEKYIHQICRN